MNFHHGLIQHHKAATTAAVAEAERLTLSSGRNVPTDSKYTISCLWRYFCISTPINKFVLELEMTAGVARNLLSGYLFRLLPPRMHLRCLWQVTTLFEAIARGHISREQVRVEEQTQGLVSRD